MKREKVENRRFFSKKEKEGILSKSNNKCVHCGKKLTPGSMTIDHFIPVSEGGTNNKLNLIPLCEKCNTDKGAIIYNVDDYCRYIKTQYKRDLEGYVEDYNKAIAWMSPNNLFKEDVISCTVEYDILHRKNAKIITLNKKVYFNKALYRDLDNVFDFVSEYNKCIGMDCQGDDLKGAISERYNEGVFYLMRDTCDRLQVVFVVQPRVVVSTGKCCLYVEIFINQSLNMSPPEDNKMVFYSNERALFFYYCDVVYEFLRILTSQFGEPVVIDYHILINNNDKFIDDIVSNITVCDYRDKNRDRSNKSEIVSLLVSSDVLKGEHAGLVKDMKNKSEKFISLCNRGSDIIRNSLVECGKVDILGDTLVIHRETESLKGCSAILSNVVVGYIRKIKSSGIRIVGFVGEGFVVCQSDNGVLKSVRFSLLSDDYGRSKTVVLYDNTKDKSNCYEYNEKEGRSYWYVNSNTAKFVLEGLVESTLGEKQSKIEESGDRVYNRMVHGNSKRQSDMYKDLSKISEFRFYERKLKKKSV